MSDPGIPKSFRHMHLFGSHTYSMINADNELVWVKLHFRTQQGIQNLTDPEAAAVIAKDRESNGRDLFESIERGDFPRWTLFIQVMTDAQAKAFRFNPFDLTKVWPKADYPLIEVGVMELNRYPDNLLCGGRAGCLLVGQCCAGYQFLAGQGATGPAILLWRRAALPAGDQLQPYPGECAEMPVP
jgi:catalase